MNTQIVAKPKKPKTLAILLSLLLIVLAFVFQLIYSKNISKDDDIKIVRRLQTELFSRDSKTIEIFLKIMYYLSNDIVIMGLLCIVYNFSNVYKSFILFNIISFGYFFSSLVKFIYIEKAPFNEDKDKDIKIYFCDLGWGLPCSQTLVVVPYYLTIWKIIVTRKNNQVNKVFKYILLIIILVYIFLLSFANLVNGGHYLNQVIFSLLVGFGLFFLIFEGLNINILDGKEFHSLIKRKLWVYLGFHLLLFIIIFVGYIIQSNTKFDDNSIQRCSGILDYGGDYFSLSLKGSEHYIKGTFLLSVYIIANFFCYLGVKMEIHYVFDDNYINWMQFNFSSEECETEDTFSTSLTISITKDTKWNNTNCISAIIRFIMFLILSAITLIPFFTIRWDSNFYLIYCLKLGLSLSLFSFGIFFLFKVALTKTNCINGALFSMIQDK